jgi:hypothetical protein
MSQLEPAQPLAYADLNVDAEDRDRSSRMNLWRRIGIGVGLAFVLGGVAYQMSPGREEGQICMALGGLVLGFFLPSLNSSRGEVPPRTSYFSQPSASPMRVVDARQGTEGAMLNYADLPLNRAESRVSRDVIVRWARRFFFAAGLGCVAGGVAYGLVNARPNDEEIGTWVGIGAFLIGMTLPRGESAGRS